MDEQPQKSHQEFIQLNQPWYVWAGKFLEDAMKSWGVPTVFMMCLVASTGWMAYRHGDAYVEATIESSRAQAEASKTVATAVVELTRLANETQSFQTRASAEHNEILKILNESRQNMIDVGEDRRKQTEILKEIRDSMEAANANHK
jgi:hypothetical protein